MTTNIDFRLPLLEAVPAGESGHGFVWNKSGVEGR